MPIFLFLPNVGSTPFSSAALDKLDMSSHFVSSLCFVIKATALPLAIYDGL